MTPTHHLGLLGARVVQTAELLLSRRAIRDLLSARALGVMHGPAGSGKTFAAELAVTEFRVERAWVQFPSRPTMLHVARRVRFAPMRPQTVLDVIPGYHPIYRDASPELIAMVDDRYAHGCFREWASFTHGALALCQERSATVLTEALARAVLELHAGGELDEAA